MTVQARWPRVLIVAILAIASLSTFMTPLRSAAAQQTKIVTVPGSPSVWVDSGVYLNTGDTVSIVASESIYVESEGVFASPDGVSGCTASGNVVLPGAPCWSLVAHINVGDVQVFEIGSSKTFTAQTSGELWLGQNADSSFQGNSGQWEATVTWNPVAPDLGPPVPSDPSAQFKTFDTYTLPLFDPVRLAECGISIYLGSSNVHIDPKLDAYKEDIKTILDVDNVAENAPHKPARALLGLLPGGSCVTLIVDTLARDPNGQSQLDDLDKCLGIPLCRQYLWQKIQAMTFFQGKQFDNSAPLLSADEIDWRLIGPKAISPIKLENYSEGQGLGDTLTGTYYQVQSSDGVRMVLYFDKVRMEITNVSGDPNSPWFITYGLLAKEMVTGEMQIGNDTFEHLDPAMVNVAGDLNDPNGPTYATFNKVMGYGEIPSGWKITQTIDRAGTVNDDPSLASYSVVVQDVGAPTNHTVASVFWDFMTSTAQSGNAFYETGFPLTEPYWTQVLVGGVSKLVLVQVFERRVLTYTPSNPDGWKVEAGNVGLQYYQWRYGQQPAASSPQAPQPTGRIAFVSTRTGQPELFVINADGTDQHQLTTKSHILEAPSWSPDGKQIVFAENANPPGLFVVNADGTGLHQLTSFWDRNPAWSPDGRFIAFARGNNDGVYCIWVMNADGSGQHPITICRQDLYPTWSPDGKQIAFYRDQYFGNDSRGLYIANADATGSLTAKQLVDNGSFVGEGELPAWSPSGQQIAFISELNSSGTADIWTMNSDGSNRTQLTSFKFGAAYPSWSPNGQEIAFAASTDGNWEIYAINVQSHSIRDITNAPGDDRWLAWSK